LPVDAAVADQNNAGPDAGQPAANALEALLAGGAGNLQALLNIPDADDETMVQLAIALSLQDQVSSIALSLPSLFSLNLSALIRLNSVSYILLLLYWRTLSVERCHTDDLEPNVPISCFSPSCVDPKVQGLKVIINCPEPGSSPATYRPPSVGRQSKCGGRHGDGPPRESCVPVLLDIISQHCTTMMTALFEYFCCLWEASH